MRNFFSRIMLFFSIIFLSCNKEEPVPAYVYVKNIKVMPSSTFGSNSSNVTDVWCVLNDNVQGVYEMPVKFPILASGETNVTFQAGIKMNGVAATRIAYPFYANYETTLNLVPGKIDTIEPVVSYTASTNIAFKEDFENSNVFVNAEATGIPTEVFEGLSSAKLNVSNTDTFVRAFSNKFTIPLSRAAVFIEIDYKNTHDFVIGIRGYNNAVSGGADIINKLVITPKENWNKIYVNITSEVNQLQITEFDLILTYNGDANENVKILFDNIKVLHQ